MGGLSATITDLMDATAIFRGDMTKKDPLKATIKDKNAKASNGRQSKKDLEDDVSTVLDTLGMEETTSRHNMKTFRQKGKK
jgi:hypothetical protein